MGKNLKTNGYMNMYKGIRLVYTEKEHVENHLYSHRKEKIKKQNANIISLRSRAPGLVTHFWSLNSPDAKAGQGGAEAVGEVVPASKPHCKTPCGGSTSPEPHGPSYSSAKRGALQRRGPSQLENL